MKLYDSNIDIFLQPGEFYFAEAPCCIRTLLGSCVAITAWHPRLKIGGMCHYMLPKRKRPGLQLNGKYAEEAMQMFEQQAHDYNTRLKEYQIKLFGGSNMFIHSTGKPQQINVARDNVAFAHKLLAQYGLEFTAMDLGHHGHRNIVFDLSTGDVWVKHSGLTER
ncbi:chemotaxis protein CheD [Arsukibacterium sp.]|uniref:chemotaxis protein CheD n=1 Tax=Arsukibacterium sp. TaxID=1977258 RepID=UPI00356ABB2B